MLRVSADLMYDIIQDPIVRAGIRLTTEINILDTPPTQSWSEWITFNETFLRQAIDEATLDPETNITETAELIAGSIAGMHILSTLLGDIPGLAGRVHAMWQQFVEARVPEPIRAQWSDRTRALFFDTEHLKPTERDIFNPNT